MRIFLKCLFLFIFFAGMMLSGRRALAYYDLYAESISINPKEPAVNEPCTVTIKVKNRGSSAITDNTGLADVRINFADFDHTLTTMEPANMAVTAVETDEYITYKWKGHSFPRA